MSGSKKKKSNIVADRRVRVAKKEWMNEMDKLKMRSSIRMKNKGIRLL